MKFAQNRTCALGSSPATAPRAAINGQCFKIKTGELSLAALAANFQQQQRLTEQLLQMAHLELQFLALFQDGNATVTNDHFNNCFKLQSRYRIYFLESKSGFLAP